ncbi:unnamed protein product [Adineta steineri]|uniref:NAD(P)(+)--arginine ADP-ribosyltransferase n=1 Tax=Adineta steineri TaxID=433720 RepID=A0A818QL47_9BILA|nr:unnamed protein product [Adineta steineri]CAF0850348.1 unnamed protein product [Adineta steineri]CAF3642051.1 unnamed protein product [Adineta steineri]CAF4078175.1 unnamed protein product [Adineta steineri]
MAFVRSFEWMWKSNVDPFSDSEPAEWKPYSDVENLIIEEAYTTSRTLAVLDNYIITFENTMQSSKTDENKQRPVKRIKCNADDNHLREDRFSFSPMNAERPFGGLYGWISPFIRETMKDLNIRPHQLPSTNEVIVPMIVTKAADGIIEEAKQIGSKIQGEKLARLLLDKKDAGMEEVWKRCAYMYTLQTFLYKIIGEAMRWIGSEKFERRWFDKVRTLGPFCLLLWDNPYCYEPTKNGTVLYRGIKIDDDIINAFQKECSKKEKTLCSLQAFTSCSRNRTKAEKFGNVLFIMTVKHAFTVDLQPVSYYPYEEEELILPSVCYTADRMEFDKRTNKHVIYLNLIQQHRRDDDYQVSRYSVNSKRQGDAISRTFDAFTRDFRDAAAHDDDLFLRLGNRGRPGFLRRTVDRLFRRREGIYRTGCEDDYD